MLNMADDTSTGNLTLGQIFRANLHTESWMQSALSPHRDPLLHVDCDLYSSTVTIFEAFGPRLQPGAIVLFDEYYNFPRWQQHEFKAFREYVAKSGVEYEYIGYSVTGQQVAVRILKNPAYTQ